MKKTVIILFVCGLAFSAFSQNEIEEQRVLTNKKGLPILPSWGDIGFGVGADPFITYFGNFFHGTDKNSLNINEPMINLRYFTGSARAYRIKIGLNFNSEAHKKYVRDDFAFTQDPLSVKQTVDKYVRSNNGFSIDLGYEVRKGKTRLQGFLGTGPHIRYANMSEGFEYGNPYSDINNSPTSFDFNLTGYSNSPNLLNYGRVVKYYEGSEWGFGLNSFLGIEYFFLPKACIGTQVDLNIVYSIRGKEKREIESRENGTTIIELLSPGGRNFNAFTMHSVLNTFLMFHF